MASASVQYSFRETMIKHSYLNLASKVEIYKKLIKCK